MSGKHVLAAAVVVAAAAAGCAPAPSPSPPPAGTAAASTAPRAAITRGVPTPPAPLTAALPDRALTPGAAGASLAQICPHVSPALEATRPDTATKAKVYAEYGIPAGQRHLFRIDHDIPLGLDGKNIIVNLWPQPYAQSLAKDKVENALHDWVCAASGAAAQARLGEAQAAISSNWVTAETMLGISP